MGAELAVEGYPWKAEDGGGEPAGPWRGAREAPGSERRRRPGERALGSLRLAPSAGPARPGPRPAPPARRSRLSGLGPGNLQPPRREASEERGARRRIKRLFSSSPRSPPLPVPRPQRVCFPSWIPLPFTSVRQTRAGLPRSPRARQARGGRGATRAVRLPRGVRLARAHLRGAWVLKRRG